MGGLIPIAEGACIERQSDVFCLTWIETHFLEPFNSRSGRVTLAEGSDYIELPDFSTCDAAGLVTSKLTFDAFGGRLCRWLRVPVLSGSRI